MRNLNQKEAQPALFRGVLILLMGLAAMITAGCGDERDANDGTVINTIALPTDAVLSLFCADVGIATETCVLDDPENPFATTTILEYSGPDNPGNKFELADGIPAGPTGAKARFYFWATALARRQSGENQYYTALALHEVFNANSNAVEQDELIRAHALRAYRSVLDNFFGSVTVFLCFECAPISTDPLTYPSIAVPLNERVADHLYRKESTASPTYPNGLRLLVPGPRVLVLDLFVEWGYTYQPCTDLPICSNGVVGVGEF